MPPSPNSHSIVNAALEGRVQAGDGVGHGQGPQKRRAVASVAGRAGSIGAGSCDESSEAVT